MKINISSIMDWVMYAMVFVVAGMSFFLCFVLVDALEMAVTGKCDMCRVIPWLLSR